MKPVDTLTIRLAGPADLAALDALLAVSYPKLLAADYPPSVLVTAVPLIARARPELLASGSYFVAHDGSGRLVAAGGWTRAAPTDGKAARWVGHVRHVVTRVGLVRRGIGRALMGCVFDQAAVAGVRQLECLSTRTAVPFYKALGFRVVAPVDVALRPGIIFPAVQMRRALAPRKAKGPVN